MSRDAYLNPYRESVSVNGTAFEATLWASPKSQRLRFEVMQDMCPMQDRRILDVGCSRGDFADWLTEHGVAYRRFIGLDAVPEVITFAQQRGLERAEFHVGDPLSDPELMGRKSPDVSCFSGTLNTMSNRQVNRLLDAAWAATGEVLIFNFLSSRCGRHAPRQESPVVRLDPLRWLDWALRRTHHVALRQDYFEHGHDATILMARR